jgi:hypothetical protein
MTAESREDRPDLMRTYHLEDRLWEVLLLTDSSWVGKTLQEIAIGSGHGLTVLSVVRHDEPQLHKQAGKQGYRSLIVVFELRWVQLPFITPARNAKKVIFNQWPYVTFFAPVTACLESVILN